MTATAEGSPPAARRQRAKSQQGSSSIWSKEIGRKSEGDGVRPPYVPALPRVNLLPPAIAYSFAVRRIRRWLIAAAAILAVAFGAIWYVQGNQIGEAQDRLSQAEAANATALERVGALAPIKQMYDQITGEQALVATTLAAQPKSALVISRLADAGAAAAGGAGPVEFTSIAIEYRGIPAAGGTFNPCPNPDPFATDITIGCVTFSGTAANRDQLSAMLTAIAADPLFVGAYLNNSTVTEPTPDSPTGVIFTGTTGISIDALELPLTDEQVTEILTPPPSEAAAEPEQQP